MSSICQDLIEQKINELSGKDILINIEFPEGTKIDQMDTKIILKGILVKFDPVNRNNGRIYDEKMQRTPQKF